MPKVAPIHKRKSDHIRINLEEDVRSQTKTGLEKYRFTHQALPEISLTDVDLSLSVFDKHLTAPILISSMTGGTDEALLLNRRLAQAAQQNGIALGVGSQRAAIENPAQTASFKICRDVAPDILLFANLGAVQLNYGYGIDECRRAVEMIEADALILHINPLQEALQKGGNTDFSALAQKITAIKKNLEVPLIVKEVGWGISERSARLLAECGVDAIDVAGAGGTSWSQVEMHRAPNDFTRQLAAPFADWGVSTADSILNVKKAAPKMTIFASGGLQNGVDFAKSIALGATLGGMAGAFLRAANESTQKVTELIELTRRQTQIAFFAAGITSLEEAQTGTHLRPAPNYTKTN
jgi:isopentenyl-diphosphate delta-isomerase